MYFVTCISDGAGLAKELEVLGHLPRARAAGLSKADIRYDAVYVIGARAAFANNPIPRDYIYSCTPHRSSVTLDVNAIFSTTETSLR